MFFMYLFLECLQKMARFKRSTDEENKFFKEASEAKNTKTSTNTWRERGGGYLGAVLIYNRMIVRAI